MLRLLLVLSALVSVSLADSCYVCIGGSTNGTTCGDELNCCATIQECLDQGIDAIYIENGRYFGNGNCDLFVGYSVSIFGEEKFNTTIDCPNEPIFTLGDRSNLTLQDLSLIRGNNNQGGGAISATWEDVGEIRLTNVMFDGCSGSQGGAIYAAVVDEQSAGTIYFSGDVSFRDNSASTVGGALSLHRMYLRIEGSYLFEGNRADTSGGAIYMKESALITGDSGHGMFSGNSAEDGAAIFSDMSRMVILESDIALNHASNRGGAIYMLNGPFGGCSHFIENSIVSNNMAELGGAFYIDSSKEYKLNFLNTSIDNNNAEEGGGLYLKGGNITGDANTVVTENHASISGGGVFLASDNKFSLRVFHNFEGDRENDIGCETNSTSFCEKQCTVKSCDECSNVCIEGEDLTDEKMCYGCESSCKGTFFWDFSGEKCDVKKMSPAGVAIIIAVVLVGLLLIIGLAVFISKKRRAGYQPI